MHFKNPYHSFMRYEFSDRMVVYRVSKAVIQHQVRDKYQYNIGDLYQHRRNEITPNNRHSPHSNIFPLGILIMFHFCINSSVKPISCVSLWRPHYLLLLDVLNASHHPQLFILLPLVRTHARRNFLLAAWNLLWLMDWVIRLPIKHLYNLTFSILLLYISFLYGAYVSVSTLSFL